MTDQIIREKRLKLRRGPLSHMPELLEGELVLDTTEWDLYIGKKEGNSVVAKKISGEGGGIDSGGSVNITQDIETDKDSTTKVPSAKAVAEYIEQQNKTEWSYDLVDFVVGFGTEPFEVYGILEYEGNPIELNDLQGLTVAFDGNEIVVNGNVVDPDVTVIEDENTTEIPGTFNLIFETTKYFVRLYFNSTYDDETQDMEYDPNKIEFYVEFFENPTGPVELELAVYKGSVELAVYKGSGGSSLNINELKDLFIQKNELKDLFIQKNELKDLFIQKGSITDKKYHYLDDSSFPSEEDYCIYQSNGDEVLEVKTNIENSRYIPNNPDELMAKGTYIKIGDVVLVDDGVLHESTNIDYAVGESDYEGASYALKHVRKHSEGEDNIFIVVGWAKELSDYYGYPKKGHTYVHAIIREPDSIDENRKELFKYFEFRKSSPSDDISQDIKADAERDDKVASAKAVFEYVNSRPGGGAGETSLKTFSLIENEMGGPGVPNAAARYGAITLEEPYYNTKGELLGSGITIKIDSYEVITNGVPSEHTVIWDHTDAPGEVPEGIIGVVFHPPNLFELTLIINAGAGFEAPTGELEMGTVIYQISLDKGELNELPDLLTIGVAKLPLTIDDVLEESEEPKLITGKALKEIIEHIINNQ